MQKNKLKDSFRSHCSQLTPQNRICSRLIKELLTCHCSEMVEATPDSGDGNRGIELRPSEQRGWNHLWGWWFWQFGAFSKNPISPNKHFSFIWRRKTIAFWFQMLKFMPDCTSRSPLTQWRKITAMQCPVWPRVELQENGLISYIS